MSSLKNRISGLSLAVLLFSFSMTGCAHSAGSEHPQEHPQEKKGSAGSLVAKEDLADAIRAYVKEDAALKGGYFLFYDKKAGKPLALKLKKVHEDRLSKVGPDTYFLCADFITPEGKTYDLDIFMKGPGAKSLKVTEITVHKEEGKERYKWREKGGIWTREETGAGGEHPTEHPTGVRPGSEEHPLGTP